MRDAVMFALDPGQTTGWALVRRRDRMVLGMGNLASEEVGCAIDLLVRSMHRLDYDVVPVVELMPTAAGIGGELAIELEFVRRTIDYWLEDVFELAVTYVPPGAWKTSRVALTTAPPREWNGVATSPHMRDAHQLACYQSLRRS